jgi:hypothetical protein
MGKKTVLTISLAIIFCFSLSLYLLDRKGKSSRVYRQTYEISESALPVYTSKNSADLLSFYKSQGFRGRLFVHIGNYLHFFGLGNDIYRGNDRFPIKVFSLFDAYEERITVKNFLWVMMQGNIAREIYYLLPDAVFYKKMKTARAEGRNVSVTADRVVANYYGSRRVISHRLPDIKEPVLLNIDASYFESTEADGLMKELKSSGLRIDALTLSFAEDNPYVTDVARERLKVFAEELLRKG